jgi:hypothetical protein
MSLGSAVRMVSPLLGVTLLHRLGWPLLCGASSGALALLTLLAWLLQPGTTAAGRPAPGSKNNKEQ